MWVIWFMSYMPVLMIEVTSQILPAFIKPCKNDWMLNRCAIANGNFAIRLLATGVSSIPPIDPLQLVSLKILENGHENIRANMTFKELYAYGLKEARVNRSDIDLRSKHMVWSLKVPRILFGFKYKINGRISSRPVYGTGNGVIEFEDVDLIYLLDFDIANISGANHIEIVHTEVRHTTQLLRIQLDNLFDGNTTQGHEMNILMNENWVELSKQLGPPIDRAFLYSLKPIVDWILTLVPIDYLFLK